MARVDAETAEQFRRAHELKSLDHLSSETILEVIRREYDVAEVTDLSVGDFVPTDNAGRPRSILVGDCTVSWDGWDDEQVTVEFLATEAHNHKDAEWNDDGTMTIPVGSEVETMYQYETLEVQFHSSS
jgi:hypothetical protein